MIILARPRPILLFPLPPFGALAVLPISLIAVVDVGVGVGVVVLARAPGPRPLALWDAQATLDLTRVRKDTEWGVVRNGRWET